MEEKHILLTGYSQVGSETFSTVLERIDKALANIENKESQSERDLQSKEEYKVLREKIENNAKQIANVDTTKEGRLLFNTVNPTWELAVENTTFEKDYLNYAYTTAESAFKELVVPSHKRNTLQGERLEDVQTYPIETVFAFTTNKVKTNSLDYTYFHDGESIPLHIEKDKEGRPQTYQEFINSRFKSILEFATDGEKTFSFVPVEVSETDAESNKSIGNVLAMVSEVDKYIKKNAEYKVIIHVDMSGGFRHIPLILMLVLNILQRSKHNIGEIMYTMLLPGNVKVERINDIFDMQRFTNGVHEFIEFGSGIELEKFYKLSKAKTDLEDSSAEYDKKVSDFTKAVNVFSNAITLSDRNEFRKAVKGIESAWKNLETDISEYDKAKRLEQQEREKNKENKKDEKTPSAIENNLGLLQAFSPRIKEEYKQLWETENELEYIKWCLKHNYIQQALTLYIEIVPEILFNDETASILSFINKENWEGNYKEKIEPYSMEYYVLNQYSVNIDAQRKEQVKRKVLESAKKCKGVLDQFLDIRDIEWLNKFKDELKEKNFEYFFSEIQSKHNISRTEMVFLKDIIWDKAILKLGESKNNWLWLFYTLTHPYELYKVYNKSIFQIREILSDLDFNEFNDKTEAEVIDLVIQTWYQRCMDNAGKESESSTDEEMFNRCSTILGYIALKNAWAGKFNKVCNEYQEKKHSIKDMTLKAIDNVKTDIDKIKNGNKKTHYLLRKNYINASQISADEVLSILLPYEEKTSVNSHNNFFNKQIASMDSQAKVTDIYALIDYDDMSEAKKEESHYDKIVIGINESLRDAFINKLIDSNKVDNIISIIKESINNDKLNVDEECYMDLIPDVINGNAPIKDIWDQDNINLLILRTILYPYYKLKLIRHDSVHARTDRYSTVTREMVGSLIENSIAIIEMYRDYCQIK
jgi:hypothetical protein